MKKRLKFKSKNSYGDENFVEFIYHGTTTICNIIDYFGNVFKGVAVLYQDDIYNKCKGEYVAFDKACSKYYTFIQKRCDYFYENECKKINNSISCLFQKLNKIQKNYERKGRK